VSKNFELRAKVLKLVQNFPQSSAIRLSRALKEQGIDVNKKIVNALLYEMATEGLVKRITTPEGKKPRWVAFDSLVETNPALEGLYLRAMKSPREKTNLAEVVADIFEALDYHRAEVVRKMADSLKR
jgi:hypothetical protein